MERQLGKTGITNGEELDTLARRLFPPDVYVGIVQYETIADLPPLKEGQFALLNSDLHWTIIYKKNGILYEFDSYGRDMLGRGYRDARFPKSFKQTMNEMNCGQKSLAFAAKQFL